MRPSPDSDALAAIVAVLAICGKTIRRARVCASPLAHNPLLGSGAPCERRTPCCWQVKEAG